MTNMGKDDAPKTTGTLSLREKLKQAEALARKLNALDRRHDEKCRKIEARAGNQKLDVSAWHAKESKRLLDEADPDVRKLVEAGWLTSSP